MGSSSSKNKPSSTASSTSPPATQHAASAPPPGSKGKTSPQTEPSIGLQPGDGSSHGAGDATEEEKAAAGADSPATTATKLPPVKTTTSPPLASTPAKVATTTTLPPVSTAVSSLKPEENKTMSKKPTTTAASAAEDESVLPLEPEGQRQFDTILRTTNALVSEDSLLKSANKNVTRLAMRRTLPDHISLTSLLAKLENLQVLDLSGNNLGPQGIRALCLALPPDSQLVSLNIADNKTDTDTAESIGTLLSNGPPLAYLDVSGNYLGKDFFSRCAGQALKTNSTLQTLRAQSIGMVDAKCFLQGLLENSCLVELDISNNDITDRKSIGAGLAECLKKSDCPLQSLALVGCNMNSEGIQMLREGLSANKSLTALNLNNNEFGSLQTMLEFVITAFSHPALVNLHLNDARVKDMDVKDAPAPSSSSSSKLQVLSLNSSQVSDDFFRRLSGVFQGKLPSLVDIDLSNNGKLTAATIEELWKMTAADGEQSGLRKLTVAMNEMETLAAQLTVQRFPNFLYLNVRKARFSPKGLSALAGILSTEGLSLTTLVLDGVKLSGKEGLKLMFANCPSSKLTAISLSGCALNDGDLSPLWEAVRSGFKLHMLKLSSNRLTDAAVKNLSEVLLSSASHPLSVLDLSGNQITDSGVKDLCSVYTNKKHNSSLHSLNLATNAIGKEGLLALVSVMGGKFPLKCLYVNDQTKSFLEADMEEVYVRLAAALGFTVKKSGETIQKGCSSLPALPDGLSVNLRGLGGHSGELGPFLDCPAITTDSTSRRLTTWTLENVLDVCSVLQGQKSSACVLSSADWNRITGADKDNSTPSWLQLPESRKKAVYLSNLPGNSTSQRLEALFEMEADCSIEEVVLMKDPVTKNNSGSAWILLSDETSVQRAMDLYNRGEALVFGTPFSVARVKVTVEDAGSSQVTAKARQDMVARQKVRAAEDRAHRLLIQQNTEESWKRHAYRLAHPAYADGRIW